MTIIFLIYTNVTLNVLHPFTSRVVWSHWLLMTSLALTLLLIGNLKSYSRPPPELYSMLVLSIWDGLCFTYLFYMHLHVITQKLNK